MIVLIAPEEDVPNEIEILHQLFNAGLQYYHLRKPFKDLKQHKEYLNKIKPEYYNRVIIHHHHELINSYNLKGIHFQEQKRRDTIDNATRYFKDLNMFGKTISSSFHDPEELNSCYFEFDYHLLSPVFNSISKKGYKGRGFNVNHINKTIVGMGGVTAENLSKFNTLGYKGIGVLGGVWNSKNPLEAFKQINEAYITSLKNRNND
ncbi:MULTISPECIES: thiamine phosphate synthase [unclassified Cellulophaga]|uniref:thiamine phosphate synthase n=1 Tax=unclassified Cellulophaga TaxID=2634405 RepID=UPI0026E39842|nr:MULTISPECIES: thiamine phosphate synthase [unclassified Cellulophaga]MDO6490279.1 thiamine phosphate synthase [Cellulophaga sp. 2_MG-2023]MDO6494527.1 thiamine phosphate synthase [Cellulophaga sp. 3_MG-2023]